MKKLTLNVDDLTVESFATAPAEGARGTVEGREDTTSCSQQGPEYTFCDYSCEFYCGATDERCTNTCPGTGTGTGTGGSAGATCYPDSGCDLSCEFAC